MLGLSELAFSVTDGGKLNWQLKARAFLGPLLEGRGAQIAGKWPETLHSRVSVVSELFQTIGALIDHTPTFCALSSKAAHGGAQEQVQDGR